MKGRITELHKALFPKKPHLKSCGKGYHATWSKQSQESILHTIRNYTKELKLERHNMDIYNVS